MSSWNSQIAEEMENITRAKLEAEEERLERASKVKRVYEKKPFVLKSRNKFEKWTTIDGYEGFYKVSTSGRIWSAYTGRILKPVIHPNSGYLKVRLKESPTSKKFDTKYVHRIVAEHFIENPQGKKEVNHNDGNKNNCTVYNLAWMTREENMRHAQMYGLGNVTLKPIEVKSIFYMCHASDFTQEEIAEMYGVSRGTISAIKNRTSWEFVTDSKVQAEMGLFE